MKNYAAIAAALAITGCASYGHISEYPGHLPGNYAEVLVGSKKFLVKYHPTNPTLLIQPTLMTSAGGGLAQGATFGAVSAQDVAGAPQTMWEAAASEFFEGTGCTVSRVTMVMSVSWEAQYSCPSGSKPPAIGKWHAVLSGVSVGVGG